MGGAYQGRGQAGGRGLHRARVELAVRVRRWGLSGAGPWPGAGLRPGCARAGRGRGEGPGRSRCPARWEELKSPGNPPHGPNWCGCAGNFRARPCVFPVNMAAPSRVRCGRVYLR